MSEKLVMGYWDCPYCEAKGLEGTVRACPNCGKPRGEDTEFYMKAKSREEIIDKGEYLTEEQAATKGKGEDWLCSYCGGLNSTLDTVCKSCGHTRDNADEGYSDVRERQEAKEANKAKRAQASTTQESSGSPIKLIIAIVAVIAIFAILFAVFSPKEAEFTITSKSWEYSVDVEQRQNVEESGWTLPDGAELIETRSEIHHYDMVLDHYETRTYVYQDWVQTGSHTEYTYKDNGDGTFTEVPQLVPDYEYVTKTQEYQEPVYINVPVPATKYYYKIWRWKYKTTVVNSGDGDEEPAFAQVDLGEDERLGAETKRYAIRGHLTDKNEEMQFAVSERLYFAKSVGDSLRVQADVSGNVVGLLED